MSLRRPTVARLLFTSDISPLCDVAQTSDCGILIIYFQYKPFMWCRLDVRLWHALLFPFQYKSFMWCPLTPDYGRFIYFYLSRRRFRHPIGLQLFLMGFREDYRLTSFYLSCSANLLSECALLIYSCAPCLCLLYLMSKLSCEYIQSTYLACWFGQVLT